MKQFLFAGLYAFTAACLGLVVGGAAGFCLCGLLVPLDTDPMAPPGSGFALMLWTAAGAVIGTIVGLTIGIIAPRVRRSEGKMTR